MITGAINVVIVDGRISLLNTRSIHVVYLDVVYLEKPRISYKFNDLTSQRNH